MERYRGRRLVSYRGAVAFPEGPRDASAATLPPLDPHVIIVFGATGDLSRRKLLPGLLHLSQAGLVAEFRIVGTSLEELGDDGFRELAREACRRFSRHPVSPEDLDSFTRRLIYVAQGAGASGLAAAVERAERELGGTPRRLYHLSIPPAAARDVVRLLGDAGLAERARVIMEKPFGTDLASARELNECVHEVFDETQIFRIDHFLGKEAAQNILALRFANGLFEPIWNRNHIDHVQIDVPETLEVGARAGFYERTGAYRDMVVTHLLRTGKRMAEGARIISIAFREPPQSMFPAGSGVGDFGPDHLTFDLDESSRLSLSFYGKRPGPGMTLEKLSMQFSLVEVNRERDTLEAYERLIRDAMNGDHTLFTTAEGIERLWEVSAPLLENPPEVLMYAPGSWGPGQIRDLIAPHRWRLPFERRWRELKATVA